MTTARLIRNREMCPECSSYGIRLTDRIRAEFLGGYIVCRSCETSLVIDHRAWWFAGMILTADGFIVVGIGLAFAVYHLRWWALPVFAALFIAVGVVVAVFSPVEAVEPVR